MSIFGSYGGTSGSPDTEDFLRKNQRTRRRNSLIVIVPDDLDHWRAFAVCVRQRLRHFTVGQLIDFLDRSPHLTSRPGLFAPVPRSTAVQTGPRPPRVVSPTVSQRLINRVLLSDCWYLSNNGVRALVVVVVEFYVY